MPPAGRVIRYWPSTIWSRVPSRSDRCGQSLELLSKDSRKSSWPSTVVGGPAGDDEPDWAGVVDDGRADDGRAFGAEPLPQAAINAPTASNAAATRACVVMPERRLKRRDGRRGGAASGRRPHPPT